MRRIGRNTGFVVMSLFFCAALNAQLPVVTTSVNTNKIFIGEQINYNIRVTMPASRYRLTWFSLPEDFGTFVLASSNKIDSSYSTGTLTFQQQLQITSFDSGHQVIPALTFQFAALSGDSAFQILSDSIAIDVSFSPADSVLPFHDIKPIMAANKERSWWFWPAIIAAALLIALITFVIIRKRKKKKNAIFNSPLSEYEEAIKSIAELRKEDLVSKSEFKLLYIRLTDIFKRYISRLDNENKMHLTGMEIINEFSRTKPENDALNKFASGIRIADAVKFAKFRPTAQQSEECINAIESSIMFIHSQQKDPGHDL